MKHFIALYCFTTSIIILSIGHYIIYNRVVYNDIFWFIMIFLGGQPSTIYTLLYGSCSGRRIFWLTFTDDSSIVFMVTVVYSPSIWWTGFQFGFISSTLYIIQPYLSWSLSKISFTLCFNHIPTATSLHTTAASVRSQPSSHTVPHVPL